MKTCWVIPLLVFCFLQSKLHGQDDPTGIELSFAGQIEPLARDHAPRPKIAVASLPLYAYGGEPLTFNVGIEAPLGTHMRLQADLYQQASGTLAANVFSEVTVSPELSFERRTFLNAACRLPTLPLVRSNTRMDVILRSVPDHPGLARELAVTLFVYPRQSPETWKKQFTAELAQSGWQRFAVCRESLVLRSFLHEWKIPFTDLGTDWPAEPDAHTLYLAGVSEADPPGSGLIPRQFSEGPGVRLILFAPRLDSLPPGVYQTAGTVGGSIWKVTLPRLFIRPAEHPENLELLDQILRQSLAGLPRPRAEIDAAAEAH